LDLVRLNQLEHACEQKALKFETTLVVRVCEHKEYVLHDAQEVLLEKRIADGSLCACKIVDHLKTH